MLEDDYSDVIRKAMVGHGLDEERLASELGINSTALSVFLRGSFSPQIVEACASLLKLKTEALLNHPQYHPQSLELPGVKRLELPFEQYSVNAWWLTDGASSLLFDLGYEARDLVEALPGRPGSVIITHADRDHVGGLAWAQREQVELHGVGKLGGVQPLAAGEILQFGALKVESVDLSGHCTPQLGYRVQGLGRDLWVVGDALFAGSMGRCRTPALYRHALDRLHTVFDVEPDGVVLLPGHGPATTLGEERIGNPFL